MIKLVLMFVVHSTVTGQTYQMHQESIGYATCEQMEDTLNESNSGLNIELKKKRLELVATYCD